MSLVETITLGGGCFWCLEAVFDQVDGVLAVESGYSNGQASAPSYEQVCSGTTGCAEVVRVSFDPQRISLREILQIFFAVHDPTTLNRQGNDVGSQYRSGIYWSDAAQREAAQAVRDDVNQALGGAVVTEVEPVSGYSPAEAHHQRYFEKHPHQGYCAVVIAPKLAKFRHAFASRIKAG